MRKLLTTICFLLLLFINVHAQDVTYSGASPCGAAAVSGTFTVPCNVSALTIQVYGGGGGAGGGGGGSNGGLFNTRGGGGGGGGAYTTISINVVPGSTFSYSIGSGGCGGSNGGDGSGGGNGSAGGNTSFSGTAAGGVPVNLVANGGARGTGGSGTGGSNGSGGAGGTASGGSTNTSGTAGSSGSGANGGAGGSGGGPSGGAGGASTAASGNQYGGAGAGGGDSPGGRGAAGVIFITYTTTTPLPVAPTTSSVAPTCSAAGSSSISNYDASATYVFIPVGPTVGAGGAITGMVTGTSYTVAAQIGGCTSSASPAFSNAPQTAPPAIPTIVATPSTCAAASGSTISNYNASYTYSFVPTGPTVGAGGLIAGMVTGTSYTVEANDGSCTSNTSASFSNSPALPVPAIPSLTSTPATCTLVGSSAISNYDPSVTYIFSPVGPAVGAGGAITGMVTSTSYTVVAQLGTCSSSASSSFSNAPPTTPPAIPTVATSPPTCSADAISTISNYNAAYTYSFVPAGPSVGAGGLIAGMVIGTSYTVEANDGSCSSNVSSAFSNTQALAVPAIPTIASTPATCSAEGSSTVSNYDPSLTYVFSPLGPSVGAGGAITGMLTGTSYTIVANNANCSSSPSSSFSNSAIVPPPAVPIVSTLLPTCIADGSSTVSNYNATLSYVFTPSGPSVGAGGAITGMSIGTNYTVEASDGTCLSGVSATFSNSAQFPTPTASISGALTYCVGSNTTLTAGGGVNYIWTDGGGAVISNNAAVSVTQGAYTVEVISADNCSATASANVTESTSLNTTISGVTAYCPGTNTTLTATGGTGYLWSNGKTTDTVIVAAGTYSVTATDAGCTGSATATVTTYTVPAFELGPNILSCEDSIVSISAASGFTNYQWTNGTAAQTINPTTAGVYTVTVTDANGCEQSDSISVSFKPCENYTFYIPNAFTPNQDGKNDLFQYYFQGVKYFEMKIFNRWGEKVFESYNEQQYWDGQFKNKACSPGVYSYMLNVVNLNNVSDKIKGTVTLIR